MEAFEKELNEAKAKDGEDADADGAPIDEVDEAELGDDPFARGGGAGEVVVVDAGSEAWLGSDRDYTYAEVRPHPPHTPPLTEHTPTAPPPVLRPTACLEPRAAQHRGKAPHARAAAAHA